MTLTDHEALAVDVASDVYRQVKGSQALDAMDHWDRFANRLRSAAYASTAARFLEQVARRYGVAHTPGNAIATLLALPGVEQRAVLRLIRQESNALSVIVRDRRDRDRSKAHAA